MAATGAPSLSRTVSGWHPNVDGPEAPANTVIVVGAGLTGSMAALMMARRGFRVVVYEARPDLRQEFHRVVEAPVEDTARAELLGASASSTKRSINLALSHRGMEALRAVGVLDTIMKQVIPMSGRAIHTIGEELAFQPYGIDNQSIYSVSRSFINSTLLDAATATSNVTLHFNYKLLRVTPQGRCTFRGPNGEITVAGRLVIGADGAYSSVRTSLLRLCRANFTQRYIHHGYKELNIAPKNGDFALQPVNALHIWPRHEFMMIALPNPDYSFTCTMFAPFEHFQSLNSDDKVKQFFESTFPDATDLLPDITEQFRENPTSALVSVNCDPWNVGDRILLMGDAAHAIVPFFGQGMNCGFEDVLVFDETLSANGNDLARAVPEFAKLRKPQADAIAELSMDNYVEMRHRSASKLHRLRKAFERTLHTMFPTWWIPLYSMVAFTRIPYDEAQRRHQSQEIILTTAARAALVVLIGGIALGGVALSRAGRRL